MQRIKRLQLFVNIFSIIVYQNLAASRFSMLILDRNRFISFCLHAYYRTE